MTEPERITVTANGRTELGGNHTDHQGGCVLASSVDLSMTATAEKRADVFLADLSKDPGEWVNLAEELPELTAALTEKALKWREGIETTWETEFQKNYSLT